MDIITHPVAILPYIFVKSTVEKSICTLPENCVKSDLKKHHLMVNQTKLIHKLEYFNEND